MLDTDQNRRRFFQLIQVKRNSQSRSVRGYREGFRSRAALRHQELAKSILLNYRTVLPSTTRLKVLRDEGKIRFQILTQRRHWRDAAFIFNQAWNDKIIRNSLTARNKRSTLRRHIINHITVGENLILDEDRHGSLSINTNNVILGKLAWGNIVACVTGFLTINGRDIVRGHKANSATGPGLRDSHGNRVNILRDNLNWEVVKLFRAA